MPTVFLGIGSNLGDRRRNIRLAVGKLNGLKNTRVIRVSRIIRSKPLGGPLQRDFLNAAVKIKTRLPARALLRQLKKIERDLGRRKTLKNGPRPIDLDILLYADKIIEGRDLMIPHPRMLEREFVVRPLLEII